MAYLVRFINPKLTGVVVKEEVRCNKPNCRCNKGNLHRWYYYHYFRRLLNGVWSLNKEYIPKNRVKYLRRKLKLTKEKENKVKKNLKMNIKLIKDTNLFLRKKTSAEEYKESLNEIT